MMNNKTEPEFLKLVEMLQEELAVYQVLLSELQCKQKAIVGGNASGLRDIISNEQAMIKNTVNISRKRNEHILKLMRSKGMTGEISLMGIIDLAKPSDRYHLINLRDQLKYAIEQIQAINNDNRYLLNSSIEFIHGLVNLFLNREPTPAGMYNTDGAVTGASRTNKMFDYQI